MKTIWSNCSIEEFSTSINLPWMPSVICYQKNLNCKNALSVQMQKVTTTNTIILITHCPLLLFHLNPLISKRKDKSHFDYSWNWDSFSRLSVFFFWVYRLSIQYNIPKHLIKFWPLICLEVILWLYGLYNNVPWIKPNYNIILRVLCVCIHKLEEYRNDPLSK